MDQVYYTIIEKESQVNKEERIKNIVEVKISILKKEI